MFRKKSDSTSDSQACQEFDYEVIRNTFIDVEYVKGECEKHKIFMPTYFLMLHDSLSKEFDKLQNERKSQ